MAACEAPTSGTLEILGRYFCAEFRWQRIRYTSVVDENGVAYRAKKIISNISPLATYGALLATEEVPESAREYLKPYTVGISALTCFIGLDCTPE